MITKEQDEKFKEAIRAKQRSKKRSLTNVRSTKDAK